MPGIAVTTSTSDCDAEKLPTPETLSTLPTLSTPEGARRDTGTARATAERAYMPARMASTRHDRWCAHPKRVLPTMTLIMKALNTIPGGTSRVGISFLPGEEEEEERGGMRRRHVLD